jgi:hypothetical protein
MKWRCKSNGVIITLKDTDTKSMLHHEGYEMVKEESIKKVTSKKGRKKRSTEVNDDTPSIS